MNHATQRCFAWLAVALACATMLTASCENALAPATTGDAAAGSPTSWSGPTGAATVTVVWPEVSARLIPTAAESITLTLEIAATGERLTGLPGMGALPFVRPSGGEPMGPQERTIYQIPTVPVRFSATAYSTRDPAAGEALATGVAVAQVHPTGEPTPVAISLDRTPLPAPTGLTATAGDGQVALTWTAPSTGRVSGYDVFRGTTSGSWPEKRNTTGLVTSTTYTDLSLTNGTTYYYVVRAVEHDEAGPDNTSQPSNEFSATPGPGAGGGHIVYDYLAPGGNYDIYKIEPGVSGAEPVPVVASPFDEGSPHVRRDGTRIVFSSDRDGPWNSYTTDLGGVALTPLTTHGSAGGPVWSADGTKVALEMNWDIWTVLSDGSGQTRLTTWGHCNTPAWSPDGTTIAFTESNDGWHYHIWAMDSATGGSKTQLTNTTWDSDPAYSPDGSRIAFVSSRDGNREVYIMGADGSGQTNLTNCGGIDMAPEWSPDGSRIVFVSDRDGNWELYTMDPDGTDVARVTYTPGQENSPSWCSQ